MSAPPAATPPTDAGRADAILAAVAEAGRTRLLEDESLSLLEALGFTPPCHSVVPGPGAIADAGIEKLPGDRVVVKLLAESVVHRTEAGGVAVVRRDARAVADAIAEMARRHPDPAARFLIAEFVPHRQETGGELLVGVRWNAEFGAVATLGLGGITAEELGALLRPAERFAAFDGGMSGDAVADALSRKGFARLVTGAFRGRGPAAPAREIGAVVQQLLGFAARTMPHRLAEIEINPLVFRDHRPVPLDAFVRLAGRAPAGAPPGPAPLEAGRRAGMQALLRPTSIAVIGVSSRMNPGRVILRNIVESGFPPEHVLVIKPGADTIEGCACVVGIEALDPPVDLLIVSVSAERAIDVVAAAARDGRARSIILIPGGMGEREGTSERVTAMQDALRVQPGVPIRPVVNGGNCLGVRSVPGSYDTLFIPRRKLAFPAVAAHPVAFLSQSGAFAIARASSLPWLNPRYLVTLGNQVDLTVGEYLELLADEMELRVFACYVEGFRPQDGMRFLEATRRITAQGRVVLLYRAGRTPAGRHAMASHTASMAGDYDVTRELATGAGALVADTIEEFDDLLTLAVRLDDRTVNGLRLAAMSNAGFECVAMADRFGPFTTATLADTTIAALDALLERSGLRDIVAARNPLDVTPIMADAAFAESARIVLSDPGVDAAIVGCVPLTPALRTLDADRPLTGAVAAPRGVVRRLAGLHDATRKAWVAVVDSGPGFDPMARAWSDAGIPVFRTADRALAAFGRYCAWRLRGSRH